MYDDGKAIISRTQRGSCDRARRYSGKHARGPATVVLFFFSPLFIGPFLFFGRSALSLFIFFYASRVFLKLLLAPLFGQLPLTLQCFLALGIFCVSLQLRQPFFLSGVPGYSGCWRSVTPSLGHNTYARFAGCSSRRGCAGTAFCRAAVACTRRGRAFFIRVGRNPYRLRWREMP